MELVFGTAQLGTDYGIQNNGKPSVENAEKLLDAAVVCGIHLFDTAAGYGNAEVILGNYLERRGLRDSAKVITKLNPDVLHNTSIERYETVLKSHIERSIKRLRTDSLGGVLFHNAEYVFCADAIKALIHMKCLGIVSRVGVSVYTPEQAVEALRYDGLDMIQVPYNVLDRRLDQNSFFKEAKDRGIMVLARSSLLQGLLTMPLRQFPSYMSFAKPYVAQFQAMCKELSLLPLEGAVGFAAAHPYIDYLVFGSDSVKQLEEYVRAAQKGMAPDIYEFFDSKFQEIPERVVMPNLWREGGGIA